MMERGQLVVQKKSTCKVVAIACSALNLAMGVFALLAAVLAAIAGFAGGSDMSELTTALIITLAVSVIMAARSAYEFYGVMVSHRTLKHIGWAWVAYPAVSVLGKLSISYMKYAEALAAGDMIKQESDIFGVVGNSVLMLLWLAIGIVLLMYQQGKLSEKRILLYLSAAAFAISVTVASIQYISFYTQTDNNTFTIMMAIAAVTSILITLGSSFVTYGVPFFLAFSMKNKSD